MDRAEHLQWCKDRANECADRGDVKEAYASMVSDMSKHEETKDHSALQLGLMMMMGGHLDSPHEMTKFINGFN